MTDIAEEENANDTQVMIHNFENTESWEDKAFNTKASQ